MRYHFYHRREDITAYRDLRDFIEALDKHKELLRVDMPVRMRPVFQVTIILHRNDPIFRGCLLGKPTTEDHTLYDVIYSAAALDMFETNGPEGVTAAYCPPEGDSISSMVIAMKPYDIGRSKNVGRTLVSSSVGKYMKYKVVVVDDDIDPFDLGQVW
jgi:UbiD family decarboxylase